MKAPPKLLGLAALVCLTTTACAPSPDELCDHVIELNKQELGDEAAKSIDKDDCVTTAERKKQLQGMLVYKREASCIMDAETLEAIGECGSSSPD